MKTNEVGAVVLAAGLSTRMGRPKMVLPWGKLTVIEKVVTTLLEADIHSVIVVTGATHLELLGILSKYDNVRLVYNPCFDNGEMLHSLQLGLRSLSPEIKGALIVLGDQPLIQKETIQMVVKTFLEKNSPLVIPSFQMRRGHPWMVSRELWGEILDIQPPKTLRDFLQAKQENITYVIVETPSIFQDLDTPEDYETQRPRD